MIPTRPRPPLLALALGALLLVAGCGSSDQAAKDRVRWAFTMPTSWDPVTSRTGADINTISLAYASLTRLNQAGEPEPALAQSWTYSKDGTALTFTLRPGLRFSDDSPLDAAAVKAFLDRGKAQKDSFLKAELQGIDRVTTDGPLRLTLHLARPDYQLPYVLAGRVGAVTSPGAARDPKRLALWPVGAGPFRMIEFTPESHAYFEKNPNYWDAANIHIRRMELTNSPDPSTLVAALLSGSIDVATRIPAHKVKEARERGLTVVIAPSLNAANVSINRNKPPFNDPRVVEALRYAFDRREFVQIVTDGIGAPTHQPFPPGYFAFDPQTETRWSYDPARARALLRAAGYGPGQLSLEIAANPQTADGGAEIAQAQLVRIGIKARIRVIPPGSSSWQSEVYVAKRPQLAVDGTIGRESPVQNLLATYGPAGIMNLSGPYAAPEFLAAVERVRRTPTDDPAYKARLHEAVRIAVAQSPSDYLYSAPWIVAARSRVKHLNLLPSQVRWEGVRVE
ncbi:peptide ABC transporter substrate-binding protein [Novosphingobium flavum]|uniref:Peptide ABC transporter substrate-binding protein n=1 Tax=Novosphingobium flavum TaxID=1778672 RepID=A0A7X1FTE9_9SPHN|nr:ABC transporter substrate-binding protein [Novosphingobium flavum]MBC2666664.1 peptide ABC transporter substrate-binding protein [Novosphingobium flavum]